MALEPITRKEKIIAGQDLTPITRMEKFLKNFGGGGGSGGGSGVQPDWNQNDETQPDFVKNRPFYEAKQIVTVENISDDTIKGFPIFAVGDTVTVIVDGVEHSLVAYDDEGYVIIGDTYNSLANGEGQFGWQIYVSETKVVMFHAAEAHTVSYFAGEEVVKIDRKYLPKAAVINCDSSSNTYSSDLTNDELYEIMLDGGQVVYCVKDQIGYNYLISWEETPSGRIDLTFGESVHVSLLSDGTIGAKPAS